MISLLNPLIAPVKRAASPRVSKSDLQVEDPGQEQQETRPEPRALNDISLTCQKYVSIVMLGDWRGRARSGSLRYKNLN